MSKTTANILAPWATSDMAEGPALTAAKDADDIAAQLDGLGETLQAAALRSVAASARASYRVATTAPMLRLLNVTNWLEYENKAIMDQWSFKLTAAGVEWATRGLNR